jgi:4a-hydroxytetrahydrobiopterin dehydratase
MHAITTKTPQISSHLPGKYGGIACQIVRVQPSAVPDRPVVAQDRSRQIGSQTRGISRMTKALSTAEITEALRSHPEWKLDGDKLVRKWTFKDFVEAMVFVNQVAAVAEAAGHHPDIDIRYNKVVLGLISHDAGGITARDTGMAAQLDREFEAK